MANSIAINMSAQVDHEENIHVLFDSIIYHHTDYSNVQDTFTKSKKDGRRRRQNNKRLVILVKN